MKGISAVVISVMFLVIAVVLAGAFLIWGRGASDAFNEGADEIEREIDGLDARIVISQVSGSDITVRNIGKPNLNTSFFNVFVDGALSSVVSRSTDSISTDQSVVLSVSGSATCRTVRVTGQYDTSDEYPFNETGTC